MATRTSITDPDDDTGAPYGGDADSRIIRQARRRFEQAKDWESTARRNWVSDMRFANGDSENHAQWDDTTLADRGGRPCLTINKTRTHNLQIVNDARQNKASIRIAAVGEGATYDAAQIYEGICRHIEYISQATQAYDTATYNQVYGGMGYWRVLTDYAHDDSFDQEIFIRRIANPLEVYLDPDIQQYDGSDAKWGIVFKDLTHEDFRADHPNHADLVNTPVAVAPLDSAREWRNERHIRVAEYYRAGARDDMLHLLSTGETVRESAVPPGYLDSIEKFGVSIVKSREVSRVAIEWFLIAGDKIIDRRDWPGQYIPIVRLPCEEVVIEDKMDRVSHTRHLRDPQRLYNWYSSSAAEFVALQSKAPFVGMAEAVEPFKKQWETANTTNASVLLYRGIDPVTGQPLSEPKRSTAPTMAAAYMEGLKIAQSEMMMATGQYQAVMGQQSNETSGIAINARQRQGDNATYHVIDHLAGAIRYTGRILLDLIPKVYNSARVMMIIAEDGSQSVVHVDPSAPDAHATVPNPDAPPPQLNPQGQPDPEQAQIDAVKTIFNPNVGRYAVIADVGPSYATKRQEAFNAFSQIMAHNPSAFGIVGDFWAANADFPGSDELQARLKLGLPAQYKGGPPPEVLQLQQAMQHTQAQAHELLGKADAEVADLKAQLADKDAKLQIENYRAESERLKAVGAIDPASLQIIVRQMVENMLGTELTPMLARHAAIEQSLSPAGGQPDPGQDAAQAAAPPAAAQP